MCEGKILPNLAAFDLENHALSAQSVLTQPGTKGLVVQFMTLDCKTCLNELAQMVERKSELDSKGVKVLVVDLMDALDPLKAALNRLGATNFPVIRDRTGAIVEAYKLGYAREDGEMSIEVPAAFFVGADGTVLKIARTAPDDFVGFAIGIIAGDKR